MNLFKILLIFTSGVLVGIFFLALVQEGNKKKYEIKEKEIKLRLNNQELQHLNSLVKQSKLSRESYLRMLINGLVPRASPSEELIDTILILRNISNSIYQLSINNPNVVQYQSDFELLQEQINQIMILIRQPTNLELWQKQV